ncbi:DUF4007 family protein [Streptomyces sp. NPDC001407]|uniref:DUF4007 family protein n=1 Tax=Streptomyces sp. NPDC001407 TaxID=3364573 RepID=UPI0036BA1CF0
MRTLLPLTNCLPAFGRHRGYPPRYGWPYKVHAALLHDPACMSRPDAPVVLGVGKSMVPAMGFWSQAFGLARRDGNGLVPTHRAHWLLDDVRGADPFLELDASLWLLHWWLLSASPCLVPSWHYLFGHAALSRYSRAELQGRLADAAETAGWKPPSASVLAADLGCLISMYAPGDPATASIEDELANPFRTLHLLEPGPPAAHTPDRSHRVTIRRGAGRRCPALIQAYASLDFAARSAGPAPGSISLAALASDPLGPGRLLLTGTTGLRRALCQVAACHPGLAIAGSADGEELLFYSDRPARLAEQVLAAAFPGCEPADGHRDAVEAVRGHG